MAGLLNGAFFIAVPLFALVPALRFNSLRVRNVALPPADRDPHLGRKFALCLFTHIGWALVLGGLLVATAELVDDALRPLAEAAEMQDDPDTPPPVPPPPKEWWNKTNRLAAALAGSGLFHGWLAWVGLLVFTNHRTRPAVGRSFVVLRFVLCGLALVAANTAAFVVFLSEGKTNYSALSPYLTVVAVCAPSAVGHLGWAVWSWRRERVADRGE